MAQEVTFRRTDFDYYEVYVNGELVNNIMIDDKLNGKFGCFDIKNLKYFGANDTTLDACKRFVTKLYEQENKERDGKMFEYKDGTLVAKETGVTYDRFAILFDGDGSVMLCYGDVEIVTAKYMVLCKAEIMSKVGFKPILVVIDDITEELCEEMNHMIECTGYSEVWLKNKGYI